MVIVDDHPAVRGGLVNLLSSTESFSVVGAAATARDGTTEIERHRPDAVLLDYHLPDEDGLSLCLRLERGPRRPRVVIYSAFADESLGLLAMIAGADGIASKAGPNEGLLTTVASVCAGERRFPPIPAQVLSAHGERLDPADVPIVGMLAHATPPAEVAQVLRVSEDWLTARRWAILRRLGARSRADRGLRRLDARAGARAARELPDPGRPAA